MILSDLLEVFYDYLSLYANNSNHYKYVKPLGMKYELPCILYNITDYDLLSKKFGYNQTKNAILEVSILTQDYDIMVDTASELEQLFEKVWDRELRQHGVRINSVRITPNTLNRGNQQIPVKQLLVNLIIS